MPSSKSITSKYVLYVSNVSGDTRTKDIRYEFQRTAGSVYQVERDYKTRSALVEMDSFRRRSSTAMSAVH